MLLFLSDLSRELLFCFVRRLQLGLQVPNSGNIHKPYNTQKNHKSKFTISPAMGKPMKSKPTATSTIREFPHWFMCNIKGFFCHSGVFFLETVAQQAREPQFLFTFGRAQEILLSRFSIRIVQRAVQVIFDKLILDRINRF